MSRALAAFSLRPAKSGPSPSTPMPMTCPAITSEPSYSVVQSPPVIPRSFVAPRSMVRFSLAGPRPAPNT